MFILILIGIFIGPNLLDILNPDDFGFAGPILSSVALILMLFEVGNQLSINKCSIVVSLSDEKNYAIANVIIFESNEIS